MGNMGRYCKAYPLTEFRKFAGWSEKLENLRKEKREENGTVVEAPRELTDNSFAYLQENYTVTDGIFLDENTIFDAVTPEWIEFCTGSLKFELPAYESATGPASEGKAAG